MNDNKTRILIVEDEKIIGLDIKNNLDPLGAKIFCLDETMNETYKIACYKINVLEQFKNHNDKNE